MMKYVSLRLRNRRSLAAIALIGAAICGACEDASSGGGSADARITFDDGLPVVMSVRVVCRLASDTPSAIAANITGADGSQSVVAGGRSYWFFGDTVRKAADRQDVVPAAVATTTDTDARDCLDLQFKTANGGVEPMFPRLDETTAWPDGVLALGDGSIVFYMVKAYRQSPFAWNVGSVGLGRIPAGSIEGERVVETIWDEDSGFGTRVAGARSPVRAGDDVIVYLALEDRRNVVARAPIARMAEFAAYTYWVGASSWTDDPARAKAMWKAEETELPPDNGVQVSFDERTGKWIALYNDAMASVKVRTAEEPWGPWSEPVAWFDCRPLVQDVYPYCYTGELHRHLTRDADGPLYMTISSQKPYDVTLIELHMATAIHEWRSDDGRRRYAASPPAADYADEGVAFYASPKPASGLAAVYEEASAGGYRYTVAAPSEDAAPAFYAYSTATEGPVATVPVRELDGALAAGVEEGEVRFFVPCPLAACEESAPGE